jgi:hypothetical protein
MRKVFLAKFGNVNAGFGSFAQAWGVDKISEIEREEGS